MSASAWAWQAENITEASLEARQSLLDNPKVQEGLAAYFARYDRYNGNIPTISGEDLDKRLFTD